MAEPEDNWETKLADLTLDPAKAKVQPTPDEAPAAPTAPAVEPVTATRPPDAVEPAPVDAAIRQALQDPKERQTVLKVEDLVERFLDDVSRDVLEFPPVFSNYQRMLAHRIAQHYGLQTSTVDYEEGQGRVIASRTKYVHVPVIRLATLDLSANSRSNLHPASSDGGSSTSNVARSNPLAPDRPRLLVRPGSTDPLRQPGSNGNEVNGQPVKSVKEREEEYLRARERLLGHLAGQQSAAGGGGGGGSAMSHGGSSGGGDGGDRLGARSNGYAGGYNNMYNGGGRGMMNGHGNGYPHAGLAPLPMGGRGGDGGRGGARKAVFKDKANDLQDPDYKRGINRFNGVARFDPNFVAAPMGPGGIYSVPTYSSEFPSLQQQQHPGVLAGRRPDYTQQQQQAAQQAPWSTSPSTSSSGGGGGSNSWRPPPPPPPNQQALHAAAVQAQAQQHAGKAGAAASYGVQHAQHAQHAQQAGGHVHPAGMPIVHPAAAAAQAQGQQVAMMRASPPMQASGMPAAAYGAMSMSPYAGMPMAMSYAMPGGAAMPAGVYPAYPGYGQMGVGMNGMGMTATPFGYVAADGTAMAMSPTAGAYAMYAPYPPGAAAYGGRQVGMSVTGVTGPGAAAVPGGAAGVNGMPMAVAMRPGGGAMGVYGMTPMHPGTPGYSYEAAAYAQQGMAMHAAQAQQQQLYQQQAYEYQQQQQQQQHFPQHHPHAGQQHGPHQSHAQHGSGGGNASRAAGFGGGAGNAGAESAAGEQ